MARAGAAGVLSVTPSYNKPTPEGLYRHFATIAGRAGVPVVLYNVPGRTGCHIDLPTLARLTTIPGVAGVKEASGNVVPHRRRRSRRTPPHFVVLSGDDALTLPVMALGGAAGDLRRLERDPQADYESDAAAAGAANYA